MRRRDLLRAMALAATTGVAGCFGNGTDEPAGNGAASPTGSATATGRPEAGPTPTHHGSESHSPTDATTSTTGDPSPDSSGTPTDAPTGTRTHIATVSPTDTRTATRTDTRTATRTDAPSPTPSPTETPTPSGGRELVDRSFRVTDESASPENDVEVTFEGAVVRLDGVIRGGGTCSTAEQRAVEYDGTEDELSVEVEVVYEESDGRGCGSSVNGIAYRARYEFRGGPPSSVSVFHHG